MREKFGDLVTARASSSIENEQKTTMLRGGKFKGERVAIVIVKSRMNREVAIVTAMLISRQLRIRLMSRI